MHLVQDPPPTVDFPDTHLQGPQEALSQVQSGARRKLLVRSLVRVLPDKGARGALPNLTVGPPFQT